MAGVGTFMRLIKFEHTLFAMPYAVAGAFLAADGWPPLEVFGWIVVAMIGARTAAMAFNRLADRRLDAENPRTAGRASATGELGALFLALATAVSSGIFFGAAWMLNELAFWLAFPTLAILLFYSITKRIFSFTHYVLGVALGLSPLGAWVAVRGSLVDAWPAVLLGVAVLFWTAGFDILYACQDEDFDRKRGLRSVPAWLGIARALRLARVSHGIVPIALVGAGVAGGLGMIYFGAIALVAGLLVFEHRLVKADDMSRVGQAFFHVNIIIGFVVMVGTLIDVLVPGVSS